MSKIDNKRKIERRARALLSNKDIPSAKMNLVRTLMKDESLQADERYRAIIELIQNCPDKKVKRPVEKKVNRQIPKAKAKVSVAGELPPASAVSSAAPTETAYYIDRIHRKYKYYKIFRKRYFVHRNNRFGIGFRMRLIPTRLLMKILRDINVFQEKILSRLTPIFTDILNDENANDPTIFNYLRLVRKWLMDMPLSKHGFNSVKWMERHSFEREFRNYVANFFSLQKLEIKTVEDILLELENRIRAMDDLKKEEVNEKDSDYTRSKKEKENLSREKLVYEYMMLMRSFLPSVITEESVLARHMKSYYRIKSLSELLMMILEALLFQRPVKLNEVVSYYEIKEPCVSNEIWDFNEDFLKKVGKDSDSLRSGHVSELKARLSSYDTLYQMLKIDDSGQNILLKAVENQWNLVDKKHYDPHVIYKDNFFNFLDGLVNYFKNAFVPVLDGTLIEFMDPKKMKHEGSIFTPSFMNDHLAALKKILDEMHFFRTNNPTFSISRDEIKRKMAENTESISHAVRFVRILGDYFYRLGKELQKYIDLHKKWIMNGSSLVDPGQIRTPIIGTEDAAEYDNGMPFPFYDCTIIGFKKTTVFTKQLQREKVLDNSLTSGIFVNVTAFAFQASYECMNEWLFRELDDRKAILNQIEAIS